MKRILFALTPLLLIMASMAPLIASAETAPAGTPHALEASADSHHESGTDAHHGAPHIDGTKMNVLWAIPFIGILLSIALFPLLKPGFWHHHYGKVSLFWGVLFFILFTVFYGPGVSFFYLLETYLLEFLPFIMLLLALFTVAGGIRLKGEMTGTPALNTLLILIGTVLASWMGTTGAAMLMIRPILRANSWRKHRVHVVVFFIFLVANIGGSLTPLGDPPLFLGFLKGVSFFWTTTHMLPPMLAASAILLAVFFIMDTFYYRKETNKPAPSPESGKLSIKGKANILLIPMITGSVLASSLDLGTAFTLHHVAMPAASLLQIVLLLSITLLSLLITSKEVRKGNEFNWEPILEVAKLFATIFITMVPPITMLRAGANGPLGAVIRGVVDNSGEFINSHFFWATGLLSSFLDNAPTYVVFFNTAGGDAASLMSTHAGTLLAISAGAVFMGANTYIGNAPNFMVKSIAEQSGIAMPSFFGYLIKYSLTILIPTFLVITLLFF